MAKRPATAPPSAKQRVRVQAGSNKSFVGDTYQNFSASLGYGASNLASGSAYAPNPITRNHTMLENMYRNSWLPKVIVDAVAEDMTRERVNVESDMPPDRIDKLEEYMEELLLWQRLNDVIKWSRLYGGCLAYILIEGQKPETPLRIDTVGKGQFKGLMVLDRWMVWPHLDDPVRDLGKDYGMPKFYEVVSDARTVPHMRIHYTRVIRMDGVELPYWQRMAENYWGLSVIEPLFDRLIAFDSATQGAAQLVYRAHLRTLKVKQLREAIAFGGAAYQGIIEMVKQLRLYQANEGITLLDADDEFETHSYGFGGLSEVLIQFGQQLSGAAQIPLVRLFGQSPAGLNATGESDIRNYYDFINSMQEDRLRRPVRMLYDLCHRSLFGEPLPEGFNFDFAPLWQLADTEKAQISGTVTQAIVNAQSAGIISNAAALKELRQNSKVTGIFSNITDEEIKDAEMMPPMPSELTDNPEAASAGREGGTEASQSQELFGSPETSAGAHGAPKIADVGLMPGHKTGLDTKEDIDDRYAHLRPMQTRKDVQRKFHVVDVQGIPVSVDESRRGFVQTDSARVSCFVGDSADSTAVWAIEQLGDDGTFEDYQFALGYPDRKTAVEGYETLQGKKIGKVRRMNIDAFRRFVEESASDRTNGAA
jgi:phage-related protein (TIGR01555 family)